MFGEPRTDGWTPPLDGDARARRAGGRRFSRRPASPTPRRSRRVAPLAAAGADFVALGDAVWSAPTPEAAAAEATKRIAAAARRAHEAGVSRSAGLAALALARVAAPRGRAAIRAAVPTAPRPRLIEPDAPLDADAAAARRPTSPSAPTSAAISSPRCARRTKRSPPIPKDAAAMTLIGEIYRDGLAVKQDVAEAARWYRLASELGDKQAAVPARRAAARRRRRRAARTAPPPRRNSRRRPRRAIPARSTISACSRSKATTRPSPISPRPPTISAARPKPATATRAYSYGVLLREGKGVPLDIAESAHWLKRAADDGIIAGQVEYAIMLFNGVGVAARRGRARRRFSSSPPRAAIRSRRTGSPISIVTGRGVPRDLVQAALWHGLAKSRRPRGHRPRRGDRAPDPRRTRPRCAT